MAATRVKICGITREEDAVAAAAAGADAIGLVFYPASARAVSIQQAVQIAAVVPPFVTLVALFVDASREDVEAVLDRVPVGVIQFHGDETREFCAQFRRPWIKALRMRDEHVLDSAGERYRGASALLLDAWRDDAPGGTGQTFDWQLAARSELLPFVLAGGLNAENVGAGIRAVAPAAVDVSGGVESAPGVKDASKISEFIAAVRAADALE